MVVVRKCTHSINERKTLHKMLDKLKFNNLIISNAKVIQKARIQTVRKIIQKERKLKMLLEKRPGDQSSVVKLRKCVAIVDVVKKIKREDAMRNILLLLMDKNPNKIVTNSQSPPEEVAIALLAVNKTMQDLVERFRKDLNYDDAESEDWKKTLIEIGKLKAKKERRKKHREHEEQKSKKQKKPKRDNAEDETSDDELGTVKSVKQTAKSEKNDQLTKKTKARKLNEIKKGQDVPTKKLKITELEKTNDDNEQPPKVQRDLRKKLAEKSINKSKARDSSESIEDDEEEVIKVMKDSKKSKEKSSGKAKVTALAESTEDDDEEVSEVTKESKKFKEKSHKKTKAKDLSESTEDDGEETSEVVRDLKKKSTKEKPAEKIKARELVEFTEDEDDFDDEELTEAMNSRKESQIKYLSGYRKFEVIPKKSKESSAKNPTAPVQVGVVDPFFRTVTGEPYVANIVLNTSSNGDVDGSDDLQNEFEVRPTKHFNNTEGRSNHKKSKTNDKESATKQEVLHPSWLAKKKINSIVEFRGKKITFDESGPSNVQPEPKKSSVEATKTDLHPSWAAKQKMKPTISAFQGKKITFDNDE